MKKSLLILVFCGVLNFSNAQTVLNETYGNPGSGNSEFVELYNSSTAGIQNLDCFTLLSYFSEGSGPSYQKGWYVLDFPNDDVAAKSWYVLAAADPFNVQSQTGVVADLNWNATSFRDGSTGGYLKKLKVNGAGTGYDDLGLADGTVVNDLLVLGDFYTGRNRLVLLFQNGVLINGFWGGGPTGILPVGITGMPDLTVTPEPGGCGSPFVVDFSTLGAIEFVNESGGSDNGYAREFDGKCGSWDKTSSGNSHTPGEANGTATGEAGSLTTSQLIICSTPRHVIFDITGTSGDVTEANDFPVEIQVYNDIDNDGMLDGTDPFIGSKFQAAIADPADTIHLVGANQNADVIVIYKTQRGCFDKVVSVLTACSPLPVKFGSFIAKRTSSSNVNLVWTTLTEINNSGFEVQRNSNGNWETIVFVATQSVSGNSESVLTYTYSDLNSAKGITQYRIRQVDMDGKSEYSMIKAVRGEGQQVRTIIYPNPATTGKVNVVFEDVNESRNVSLTDMTGRTVQQWRNVTNNNLQIENLILGIYMLRIAVPATGEQSIEKIVVNDR